VPQRVAQGTWIAKIDLEAFAPINHRADVFATDCALYQALHIGYGNAIGAACARLMSMSR